MKIINLKGEIVSNDIASIYRAWGYNCSCPKDFEEIVNGDEDVEIIINSRGGSVLDASEIYTALKDYKGKVTVKIVGFAGSCASWIAMAADEVKISPMGFIMIHNSSSIAIGDNREMDKSSNMLKTIDTSIKTAYQSKTGLSDEELTELMNNESWFDAKTAVEKNFADEIMFDEEVIITNSFLNELELPSDKILNYINKSKNKEEREEVVMDLKELQEKYPDLFNKVKDLGKEEERKRISEIENLEVQGFEELINKAKYETLETPEKLAMNILKAQKEKGEQEIKDFLDDKDFVVEHDHHEEKIKNTNKDENFAKLISNFANDVRGVK